MTENSLMDEAMKTARWIDRQNADLPNSAFARTPREIKEAHLTKPTPAPKPDLSQLKSPLTEPLKRKLKPVE